MSNPFPRIPEPETSPPFKRRLQPDGVQHVLKQAWREARRQGENLSRRGKDLWRRGMRQPKVMGLVAGALAVTLLGAYTLSASGVRRSACASAKASSQASKAKAESFFLLMDPVKGTVAGSELEIHYDVCGLPSGAAYRGRVQISQQQRTTKKKSAAKPKPVVVTFRDKVDGPATRRHRELELGQLKPGAYTLELTVADAGGRQRKSLQRIRVTAR